MSKPGRKPLLLAAFLILTAFVSVVFLNPGLFGNVFHAGALFPGASSHASAARAYTDWDPEKYPEYYRIVGEASAIDGPAVGEVCYSGLDGLGRAGRCVVNATYGLMEEGRARDREDMSELKPSGWGHNRKVELLGSDGTASTQYLFNRSHLIAHSLGGEERIENLVCGTRCQNVGSGKGHDGGMAFCEGLARDYLESHRDASLLYSAEPVYEGDELVCRSVIVDMRSTDGELNLEVEVYNAARGYSIDYATGEFS